MPEGIVRSDEKFARLGHVGARHAELRCIESLRTARASVTQLISSYRLVMTMSPLNVRMTSV